VGECQLPAMKMVIPGGTGQSAEFFVARSHLPVMKSLF
jgi:hypothetical protein